RMVEQPTACTEVQAGGLVLLALPADANPEVDTTSGDDVEGGELLGEDDRPPQRREQDVRAKPDARRLGGHRGEDGQRLEPVPIGTGGLPSTLDAAGLGSAVGLEVLAEYHVVGDDDTVDAGGISGSGEREQVVPVPG